MEVAYVFAALLSSTVARSFESPSSFSSFSTITPAPRISVQLVDRQNDNRFIGWVYSDGRWESSACSGDQETLYTDGYRFACCTSDPCNPVVFCSHGSIISPRPSGTPHKTSACSDIFKNESFTLCNTDLLYENTLYPVPISHIRCGDNPENWSFYRHKPMETNAKNSTTSSSELSTSTPPVETVGIISAVPAPRKNNDKSWIAAAVILPIAFAGGLLYFLIGRIKKKTSSAEPPFVNSGPSYGGTQEQKHESYLASASDPPLPPELLPSEATELESPNSFVPTDIPPASVTQQMQRGCLPPSLQIRFPPTTRTSSPPGVDRSADDPAQTVDHTTPSELEGQITPNGNSGGPDTRGPELAGK